MTVVRDVDTIWRELNQKKLPKSSSNVKADAAIPNPVLKDSAVTGSVHDRSDQQSQDLVTTSTNAPATADCSQLDLDAQVAPDAVIAVLPYAVPVLEERLQAQEVTQGEQTEELRLSLLHLVTEIIASARKAIAPYGGQITEILQQCCDDSYHEVCLQACRSIQKLVETVGMMLFSVSKQLMAAVMPLLTHKRHKVRIEASCTVKKLAHMGGHEMVLQMVAWQDPQAIAIKAFYEPDLHVNFCAKLATDPVVQVRLAFVDMLADWMLTLRERIDHHARLMPYALSALSDPSQDVQRAALKLLNDLGMQYEEEHQQDLKDTLYYLPAEAHALGWQQQGLAQRLYHQLAPPDNLPLPMAKDSGTTSATSTQATDVAHAVALPSMSTHADNSSTFSYNASSAAAAAAWQGRHDADEKTKVHGMTQAFQLPAPFRERPRTGSRIFVQSHFPGIAGALASEMLSWQQDNRNRAVELLRSCLMYVEEQVGQHLLKLLPALCQAKRDSELGVGVQQCCTLIGCFVPSQDYMPLLMVQLESAADPAAEAACIVREAADNLMHVLTYLQDSASALAQDTSLRHHVIQLLHAAVTSAPEAVERQAEWTLVLLLQLRANVMLAADLPAAQLQQVDATLLAVAAACNCSLGKLISNHHGRLSDVLKPAVGGLHPAVDLAAYVHLLLPWQVVHSACRQAVSGAHTASKVPEYLSPITADQSCIGFPAILKALQVYLEAVAMFVISPA
ncbi:MAG: hypothetical protein FRX49_04465 [Trebouxia sp. A1-2]|nr:MAG: hypothetical protein FRX49_04465 [Trebouxia sp. A1-2]